MLKTYEIFLIGKMFDTLFGEIRRAHGSGNNPLFTESDRQSEFACLVLKSCKSIDKPKVSRYNKIR